MTRAPLVRIALLVLVVGCGSNVYGYARQYEPLGEEAAFFAGAVQPPFVELQRDPASFEGRLIAWFGVVREAVAQDDGTMLVRMSQRAHIDRHLCADRSDSSCRVTVSERHAGDFSVRVRLRPGSDTEGTNRVQRESLIRIYGYPTGEYDVNGGPFLGVEYYRHWPRGQYVDTTAQFLMRR